MFLLDDLILRALGISIPGLDLIYTLEIIKNLAYKELYNPEKVKNEIKENQMLYEFGEVPREEFEETKSRLMEQLKFAERFEEMNLSVRSDILA
ncbi:hypothetical protein FXV91_04485 [Methanosarcina sp. DH2]|uniref:gas vesicle protein GvpG n=1 Tax=Methanosarcina sp. DH2 TaxID=2605639 RepID=UPI001E61E19F|nr:hypothetical protein [Methanosarcina sp. DH2]MCC4769478.1 hypothetical protein [Methanosarcina sp. DH2]